MSEAEKQKWRELVRSVSKDTHRRVVVEAHEVGGLSTQEIATELGVSRLRVKQIIREVRAEREA